MGLKPEKYLHLARLYEKLGRNQSVTTQTRFEFERKAKWHRILARTSSSFDQPDVAPQTRTEVEPEALLFSPVRLWQARTIGLCRKVQTNDSSPAPTLRPLDSSAGKLGEATFDLSIFVAESAIASACKIGDEESKAR